MNDLGRLIENLDKRPGVTDRQIEEFAATTRHLALPDDYLAFLRASNGAEGPIGENSYVILWSLDDLVRLNRAYEVEEYAPGLFLFGSDGGGEAFAFDTRRAMRIVRVPFVGMDLREVIDVGQSFLEFLRSLEQA